MIITQKVYKFKNDALNNYTQWESNPRNPEHELIVFYHYTSAQALSDHLAKRYLFHTLIN